MWQSRLLLWLLAVGVWACDPAIAQAPDGSDTFARIRRYIVEVTASDQGGAERKGAGIIVGTNEVVTNCHVVSAGTSLVVQFSDGERSSAALGGRFGGLDLCALAVRTGDRPRAEIVPLANVKVGQKVFAIGSPFSLSLTLSDGLISGLRQVEGHTMIQTSAPISPGSSGGGLFDSAGRLLGITTFTLRGGQNLNFAIPAEYVRTVRVAPVTRDTAARTEATSFTFKGIAFGTPLAAFREAFPGASCRNSKGLGGAPIILCEGGPIEYLGRPGGYTATFVRERLSSVWFTWGALREDPKAVAEVIQERIEKFFGKPSHDRWEEVRRSGPEGSLASWRVAEGQTISLSFCQTVMPVFCEMPSVTVTLTHDRFSAQASPSKDF